MIVRAVRGMGPITADLWCSARQRGLTAAARELAMLTTAKVYVRSDERIFISALEVVPPLAELDGYRVEPLDDSNNALLDEFIRRHCDSRASGRFAAHLADGAKALLAFVGPELVGYLWYTPGERAGRRPILRRLRVRVGSDEAYAYDLFVTPGRRGQALATRLMLSFEAELRRLGYRHYWGVVDASNHTAWKLYSKFGIRLVFSSHSRVLVSKVILTRRWLFLMHEGLLRPLRTPNALSFLDLGPSRRVPPLPDAVPQGR